MIKVPVFDQQRINFSGAKLPDTLTDSEIYNAGGGTIILRKVQLPDSAEVAGRDILPKWCNIPTAMPTTAPGRYLWCLPTASSRLSTAARSEIGARIYGSRQRDIPRTGVDPRL